MGLNKGQLEWLTRIEAVAEPAESEVQAAQALLRLTSTNSEQVRLAAVCSRARDTGGGSARPATSPATSDDRWAAIDLIPDVDPAVARALVAAEIRVSEVPLAVKFLTAGEPMTLGEAREEVALLKQDWPNMFGNTAPPNRAASRPLAHRKPGENVKDAGRRLAVERGRAKTND